MGISAFVGPLVVYGHRNPPGAGAPNNADLAPNLTWGGWGLMDQRVGYNNTRLGALGWYGDGSGIVVVDAVPSAISAVNIAASQTPAAAALTLVTTTGAGITVLATALQVWASGNTIPAGTLAIDGPSGLLSAGAALAVVSTGTTRISMYDPTKAIARAVRITSGGDDTGITFRVVGYDIYGYPMSETITGASGGVATGKKAFKFITSITPSASVATTASVGTADIFGFGLRVDSQIYAPIVWNAALITASTGYVYAVTTTASGTTGDTRGTYAVQSASDGTKRLQMIVRVNPVNIMSATPSSGLYGVAQA